MTDNPRQVRYDSRTHTADQSEFRHEWYFFILNASQEIGRIQERILRELEPCGELTELETGILVPKNSLRARLIIFQSNTGEIPSKRRIYDSPKFCRDRDLRPMNDVQLDNYAMKFI